jgi:uncharacterized protein
MAQLAELLGKLAELEQFGVLAQLLTPRMIEAAHAPKDIVAVSLANAGWRHRLQLLILQPTPFCNLDCDYCYLTDRANRRRMDFGTLDAAVGKVFAARLAAPELSVIWHAGEPLAVPQEWYAEAFARVERHRLPSVRVTHHFQTNGVLLDERWCELINKHGVRVGVSLDGPDWLHDRHRKTRDGRGTHARVMRGVEQLRAAGIPFHVICVVTRESLAHADAIFDFFATLGVTHLCFNIEEIEAANSTSSLADRRADMEFRAFFARIIERRRMAPSVFRVREIDGVIAALRHPAFGTLSGNSQNEPGRILNVAWDGTFSTYSPELLGQAHPRLASLALGNVLFDDLVPGVAHAAFTKMAAEIEAGVARCRASCKYFDFCLGGAPANKLAENGSFDSTETMFCRLTQKAVIDVVLEALDRDLLPGTSSQAQLGLDRGIPT